MTTNSSIVLSSYRVGEISVDENRIRGEGGSLSPALVVPVKVELLNRQESQDLVITKLQASLLAGAPPSATVQIGAPVTIDPLLDGGIWASSPSAPVDHQRELRFPLTQELIRLLEGVAHRATGSLDLELRFGVSVAWLREEVAGALPTGMGTAVDLLPVGWCRIDSAALHIPLAAWATEILPSLGGDRFRLVVFRLPDPLGPLGREIASWFDQARAKYDGGDYRAALERCRDLRHAVERHLDAVEGRKIGERVAALADLPSDSITIVFLDIAWKSLVDLTNEAHHAKNPSESFKHSARAGLLVASALLECISDLLSPKQL